MTLNRALPALILFGIIAVAVLSFTKPPSHASISCRGCNVIVIGVDTLRADHTGSLNYWRDTTPAIDALAKKGYVFTNAISPASWTVPAFMAVFTGRYPSETGVVNKFTLFTKKEQKLTNLKELSPGTKTLAEWLRAAGYATGGFTGDAGVSGKFGYSQGFDTYTDETTFGGLENSEAHALAWLDSVGDKKFFMFFHGYDLHGQFAIPQGYASRYASPEYRGPYAGTAKEEEKLREDQLAGPLAHTDADTEFWNAWYDGKLRDADERLQGFIDELGARGLLENTVIVLLSDHGEEFFDHGGFDHGLTLYDELIHVPFLVVVPGTPGGERIASQVSTIDLAPTLFDILGMSEARKDAEQLGRRSLVPYLKNPLTPGYDVFSETDYRDFTHKRSVRSSDGWKFIRTLETGKEELYDLGVDPGEKRNVIEVNEKKAEELRSELRIHMSETLGVNPDAPVSHGCLPVYSGECL